MSEQIAIILIRSTIGCTSQVKATLKMLNLIKKNNCVVVPATPSYLGMIKKIKDIVTWGIVNEEALAALKKRQEKELPFYRLCPPRKGYGRKGIKVPFAVGGGLGDRKDKISELIMRMV